jgi:hypothetical protein
VAVRVDPESRRRQGHLMKKWDKSAQGSGRRY